MLQTTNLKLKKYEDNDVADPSIGINPNMDIIDREIKKLLDSVGNLASLNTTQKTNLVGAINEVLSKFNSIKLEAENVTITDLENLFTATKVEGALSEVMKKANTNATNILSHGTKIANIENELGTNKVTLENNINAIREVL